MRFRDRLMIFFSGRNGADQLCQTVMWAGLILTVSNLFLNSSVVALLVLLMLVYSTFRMLSRNVWKRQRENMAFLKVVNSVGKWIKLQKNKWKDRKTHVYRRCPQCKNTLRLPRIKGEHRVCCPCCRNRFGINV